MASLVTPPGAIVPLDATVAPAALLAPVGGDAAFVRVVRALLGPGRIPEERVVVSAVRALCDEVRSMLDAAGHSGVVVRRCAAPGARSDCLAAGLEYLAALSAAEVLVGDYRCPLVSAEATDRVIAGLQAGHPVVVPVVPITDTVKETDHDGSVMTTVDRTTLRSVQYPRGYRVSTLAPLIGGGDEFLAAVAQGTPVLTVDGDADATIAELPRDAALLDAIIAARG